MPLTNSAHYPDSACLQRISYTVSIDCLAEDRMSLKKKGDVFDIRWGKKTVKCLQMFCTAPLLRHVTSTFLVITVNTAHFRRWVTTAKADSFSLLHQWYFLIWITAVCLEVGAKLCVEFGIIESDCSEKNNHENLFMLSSSTVAPACLDNLACQWMLQMPYKKKKKKKLCFLNWTHVFCFGLTCITKPCVSSVSFRSISWWVPSKVQF